MTTSIAERAPAICLVSWNRSPDGGISSSLNAERLRTSRYACSILVDGLFPQASVIHVVLDNLNTHTPASLYKTFIPEQALHILERIEFHYTPKHGSWLNMVELEFSVLSRQCLNRRIPSLRQLRRQVRAWEEERNQVKATVDWQFSIVDARSKLARLYPAPSLA